LVIDEWAYLRGFASPSAAG